MAAESGNDAFHQPEAKQRRERLHRRVTTCSFCGRTSREAGLMVEGPGDVFMCADCVAKAVTAVEWMRADGLLPPRNSS